MHQQMLKPLKLLLTMELQQFCRHRSFHPRSKRVKISGEQHKPTHHIRLLHHLEADPEDLPQRVIAKEVILPAVIKPGLPGVTFSGAHRAMVIKELFIERPRLPTLQASGPDRDPINPTPFNRCVPADFMKTLTPKQLARSEHVADIVETVLQGLIFRFSHRSAGHAKSGKFIKFADQEFEIITFKGDVSVKVPNYFERKRPNLFKSSIERVGFTGEIAIHAL